MAHSVSISPASLSSAQAYFAAGNFLKACEELEHLDEATRLLPAALEMRYHIGVAIDDWKMSLEASSRLVEVCPERVSSWIQYATALHQLNCTDTAIQMLEPVVGMFPRDWQIPYNLARFHCARGNWDQTWNWLTTAFGVGDSKKIRDMAFEDPALQTFLANLEKS